MKKLIAMILTIALTAVLAGGCGGTVSGGNCLSYDKSGSVAFDFSERDGTKTQYIKKFDQFATTWSFVGDMPGYVRETSVNQLGAVRDLNAESLRVDLFMGYTGIGYGIGSTPEKNGTSDGEYEQAMQVIRGMQDNAVLPQLVLFACPTYAQSYGSWKAKPLADKWQELCCNMAAYMKEREIRIGAYELWNEPDFGNNYFDGTWEDYIDTYIAGASGIRAADPDAFIQGMSASWIHKIVAEKEDGQSLTRWERFIRRTAEAGVLPDSISWHFYGRDCKLEGIQGVSGDGENFSVYRSAILNALTASQNGTSENDSARYDLSTMQQHLNEFNIYVPLGEDSRDTWNTVKVVPGMFDAMETLLAANDITRVNWATFISEQTNGIGCSAIDLYSLQRYPAYHANWMYGRLPVGRIAAPALGGLSAMAAVDDGRAGLIVYNGTGKTASAKVSFEGIPFEKGDVFVYLVDDEHLTYSTANPPCLVEWAEDVSVNDLAANLELKPDAAYYIEIDNADGTPAAHETDNPLREHIVRKDYWYPSRGDNTPYSDIHENSLCSVVSMNGNALGRSAACVTLDGMDEYSSLKIAYDTYGEFAPGDAAALGVKLDFMTDAGYVRSVYLSFEGLDEDLLLPFGSAAAATDTESFGARGKGIKTVGLKSLAPAGWTGRLAVSYLIADAGASATAQFQLSAV